MNTSHLVRIRDNFITELQSAADGNASSLAFIRNQLPDRTWTHDDELFQVIVIGGSFFSSTLIKKTHSSLKIISSTNGQPVTFHSKTDFLEFITGAIASNITALAINLAYPLKPQDGQVLPDGILLRGTKENSFDGLVGKSVGESIRHQLAINHKDNFPIAVANDAVCLLLSGLDRQDNLQYAGAIMGTGTNITFSYNQEIINLESGNFNKFQPSPETIQIDMQSLHKGEGLFEKETAGAYLFRHYNLLIKSCNIPAEPIENTKTLCDLARDNSTPAGKLARKLTDRSAAYFAAQLAGLAEFTKRDLSVITEGSLYWENPLYIESAAIYLKSLTGLKINLVKIPNSSILGAARLISPSLI